MCSVILQKQRKDLETQVAQVVPMRAELASVAEDRDALRGKLKDFAVST